MRKTTLYCGLIACLLGIACTEEIPLVLPTEEQRIVVNSLLSDGRPAQVYLSKTISISDTLPPTVDQAQVILFNAESGVLLDSLRYRPGQLTYTGTRKLNLFDIPIRLRVEVDGQFVMAQTTIPHPVRLLSADMIFPSGFDEYGDGLTEYHVRFNDPAEEENYYELFFFYYATDKNTQRESSSFVSNEFLAYVDPVIRAEGLEEYDNKSLLFSDQLFNGESTQIVVKYLPLSSQGEASTLIDTTQINQRKSYALLRSVSKEYYGYRKAWTIHRYTQQREPAALQEDPLLEDFSRFLFVGDPVKMSNTIENGVGVFAGYSQSIMEIEIL